MTTSDIPTWVAALTAVAALIYAGKQVKLQTIAHELGQAQRIVVTLDETPVTGGPPQLTVHNDSDASISACQIGIRLLPRTTWRLVLLPDRVPPDFQSPIWQRHLDVLPPSKKDVIDVHLGSETDSTDWDLRYQFTDAAGRVWWRCLPEGHVEPGMTRKRAKRQRTGGYLFAVLSLGIAACLSFVAYWNLNHDRQLDAVGPIISAAIFLLVTRASYLIARHASPQDYPTDRYTSRPRKQRSAPPDPATLAGAQQLGTDDPAGKQPRNQRTPGAAPLKSTSPGQGEEPGASAPPPEPSPGHDTSPVRGDGTAPNRTAPEGAPRLD